MEERKEVLLATWATLSTGLQQGGLAESLTGDDTVDLWGRIVMFVHQRAVPFTLQSPLEQLCSSLLGAPHRVHSTTAQTLLACRSAAAASDEADESGEGSDMSVESECGGGELSSMFSSGVS